MPLHLRHGYTNEQGRGASSSSPSTSPTTDTLPTLRSDIGRNPLHEEDDGKGKRNRSICFNTRVASRSSSLVRFLLVLVALAFSFQLLGRVPPSHHTTRQTSTVENHLPKASPLRPLDTSDYDHYTVRINTWQREDQLSVSIQHFLSCDRVALVQVIWCLAQGPPPTWLLESWPDRVVVEAHTENSLNARFDVLLPPPTKGILTVDDDVLRPCLALDSAFVKWTSNPDRMVGFDARTHVVEEPSSSSSNNTAVWKYGYLSETTRSNHYSLTLSRFAFIHVDYLKSYTEEIPQEYLEIVREHMNCEDILLSFWVSHLTEDQPPLLADYWAMKSQVKLWSPKTISGSSQHKRTRDICVDTFRREFALDHLVKATWVHHESGTRALDVWQAGMPAEVSFAESQSSIKEALNRWKEGVVSDMGPELLKMIQDTANFPYEEGLIEGTPPWQAKFNKNP
jgi:glucuronyl/N-acetylglucosaminyl transferase EXT2